ncbi:MAG: Ig-like domain repeat protein [Candidatus Acidiferrales bacterium]
MRLPNRKLLFAAVLAFFSPLVMAVSAQTTSVQPRITQAVDESSRVTLKGTVHRLANAANDAGAAPDDMPLERLHLVLKRSPAQETALQQLISDMHSPGSASYHKWLTPEQFGEQFGPADQDVATVESWLGSHGFQVSKVEPGKQVIEFSGNVAQMRGAFHTQIHKYMVNGETHFANASDPQIPAALAPVVGGFASLNNFRAHRETQLLGKATYDPATHKATPQWNYPVPGGVNYVVTPGDFAVQYDLNPLYTAGTKGTGQTIAIINDANINVYLANQFRSIFGLSANPPQVIIDGNDPGIDGINNPDGPNYDSIEAYIDVEWSGAAAPGATVDLVIGADTALESGLFLAAERAVYGNVAPVLSLSFGLCEADLGSAYNAFFNQLWEEAAAQGQTVLVASGDSASAGCDDPGQSYAVDGLAVNGLASTPFDVAVGGTDFFYSDYNSTPAALNAQLATYWGAPTTTNSPATSLLTPIPEQPWNNSQYGLDIVNFYAESGDLATTIIGGGGGASILYTKPSWQTGTGVPADGVRDLPDLSLFASNGANASFYPSCASDGDCQPGGTPVQISGAGGTSFASPEFAGIMALVVQKYGRQGQANFVLYPLKANYPAAFHDVTNGTNSVPCEFLPTHTANCISAGAGAIVLGGVTEGQLGTGATADYNAAAGYNLATGLGTVDANVLVTDWNNIITALHPSATTLTPSSTSFAHRTPITISGTVTGSTPTGDVALMTDSTEPANQGQAFFTLSGGSYSSSTLFPSGITFLPGGTYNIWGQYGGDSKNASSTSGKTSITVTPENSGVALNIGNTNGSTVNPSGAAYGTQLILVAQPYPSSCPSPPAACVTTYTYPTGTVTFSDNGAAINTAVVNAEGDAEYNSAFSVGSHLVTAAYSGDNSYNSSTSSAVAFTIVKDTPAIFLSASNVDSSSQIITGQVTTINIQIENNTINEAGFSVPAAAPTGTVTVKVGNILSTTVGLAPAVDPNTVFPDGVATVSLPANTAAGNYNVTITYNGDSNYASTSASGSITVVGTGGLTSTTAASISGSISPTTSISVTGTVTGQSGHPAPTGFVFLFSSGNSLGEVGITPGAGDSSTFSVTLDSQDLLEGSNFITVQYVGDANYAPSATTLNGGAAVSNPLSDFSIVPQTTIVPVAAGGLSSDVVNVNSVNGFGGVVSFTCTAAAGITCSTPSSVTVLSGSSAALTLNISATSPLATANYNVLLTGTFGSFVHTLAIEAAVSPNAALNLNLTATPPNPTPIIITTPGQTGTSLVTATAEGGLTGTVNFSVVLSPNNLFEPPDCFFTSPSVAFSGGKAQSTLSCTTTAVVTEVVPTANRPQGPGWLRVSATLAASAAICFLLLFMPVRRRRVFALFAALAFIVIAFGCGGSSGGGGGGGGGGTPNPGTTLGTYYATVNASVTNGGVTVTQSTTIPVTVE